MHRKGNPLVLSIVCGVPDRVYDTAVKAWMRDPSRPVRLNDFMTSQDELFGVLTSIQLGCYENWDEKVDYYNRPNSHKGYGGN